jgi:hypothetical protein
MFIYIHILSYYKLFLYLNWFLSVMWDSLSSSCTSISFLTDPEFLILFVFLNTVVLFISYLIRQHSDFFKNGGYRSTSFSTTSKRYNTIWTHVITASHYRSEKWKDNVDNNFCKITLPVINSLLYQLKLSKKWTNGVFMG